MGEQKWMERGMRVGGRPLKKGSIDRATGEVAEG